jgi:hercynine metabolism protein
MSPSWLEELEARLETQLEEFLQANPRQEQMLAEQEARERQRELLQRRLRLQADAEATRQRLLELAEEIRRWQARVTKARAADADALAVRAEAHIARLMEQGRQAWQELAELGQAFTALEAELEALGRAATPAGDSATHRSPAAASGSATQAPPAAAGSPRAGGDSPAGGSEPSASSAAGASSSASLDLEASWADFEARQDLEELRRRLQR